jgi:magnesium chelatase family protein
MDGLGNVLRSGRATPAWSKGGAPIPADPIVVIVVDADPSAGGHDPILDRLAAFFDVAVDVAPTSSDMRRHLPCGEPSAVVAARVSRARRAVRPPRHAGTVQHGACDPAAARLVADAAFRFGLDAERLASASRVARTIADLAGSTLVGPRHVAEALAFRNRRSGASRAA